MNRRRSQPLILWTSLLILLALAPAARAQWTAPTDEELKMTSQPEVPGAPAVYLFREEITEDKYHSWSKYVRLKVLTEKGKDYANVELKQYQYSDERGYKIGEIQGRTIHPDGTIIPFTGKPVDKIVEQRPGFKETSRVFTLPGVEVGSIIEYRYQLEYYDHVVIPPTWEVQSELFTRKAHYLWRPTMNLVNVSDGKGGQMALSIGWLPVLPKDAAFTHATMSGTGIRAGQDGQSIMELKVQNVPPMPQEPDMPPADSLRYHVRFYFTPYLTSEQFWKGEGARWSSTRNQFIGPDPKVTAAVQQLVAASDTPEQKLHKIYAAVMQIDNSSFHASAPAATTTQPPPDPPKTTDDIWERRRGSGREITELLVAMARAAGMKAYLMAVADRSRTLFVFNYLSLSQLNDYVAIVNVDGKEQFFDPGQRDCPYGQLAWQDAPSEGLRQTETGTSVVPTPASSYKDTRIQRVADLALDEQGIATGTIKITWTGAEALHWRQLGERGDVLNLQRYLIAAMQKMLPGGMAVSVGGIQNLTEFESPFIVTFDVKGPVASVAGNRLLLHGELFEANATPRFPLRERQLPVYLQYPFQITDAVRLSLPKGFTLDGAPGNQSLPFQKSAVYSFTVDVAPTSITLRRDLVVGNLAYPVTDYPDLRAFYGKLETKDHETIALKAATSASGN